jgi:hypothetical protein
MEWADLLKWIAVAGGGLIGLLSCRLMLRSTAIGVEQLAAVGLIQALERSGPPSGDSLQSLDRVRALCVSALTRVPWTRQARFPIYHFDPKGFYYHDTR